MNLPDGWSCPECGAGSEWGILNLGKVTRTPSGDTIHMKNREVECINCGHIEEYGPGDRMVKEVGS